MPIINLKPPYSRRYRRFVPLFHREKPSYPNMSHTYHYLVHFPRLPITLPPFVPTFLSSRWNNDDDDCEPLSRKLPPNYHQYQHIRRRIPKRYSDIVRPSSTKMFLSRKDSTNRQRHHLSNRSSAYVLRRHSLKPLNETIYYFNSSKRKTREIKEPRYHQTIKHNDHLAHRMQAAMSSELMNSLDRNFVLNERRHLMNHLLIPRSHSFHICASWSKKSRQNPFHHFIPRVKLNLKKENIILDEPTPDYDEEDEEEEVIMQTIENENEIKEESVDDYDDLRPIINGESDEKTTTPSDQGASSSFIVPQVSTNNLDKQRSTPPPPPPPLPDVQNVQKQRTFRCRTIADGLSSDHKLILKDEESPVNQSEQPQPHYIHVSKELAFRKISQTLSRSHSLFSSISQSNNRTSELKPSLTDEQSQDGLSSSSPTTSIVNDNEYEHRSSSSKIYHEYKKRTSLTTIPSTITRHQSMLIHPMHTRIGLRSSTSSTSTNEKLPDMTLAGKQMNVRVINQLNEHLSTRFCKQQKQNFSANNNNKIDRQNYDSPPSELMSKDNQLQSNVYDEPTDSPMNNQLCPPSIPPPPPPLPVGGFRPIPSFENRLSNSQRTSILTLSREGNNSDMPACGNGTSTISSNLSDTRILRELRDNPLFTRAKEHLEIEPGSNGRRSGRRSNGPTINLTHTDGASNDTVSYLRLDNCSKSTVKKSSESSIPKQLETIIMLPNELDAIIGKRAKSTTNLNQTKSHSSIKSFNQTPGRQSELELIFQKRAQRSEQNLT